MCCNMYASCKVLCTGASTIKVIPLGSSSPTQTTASFNQNATCLCRLTVTRLVSHVEQGLLTLTAHLNFPRIFRGVRIARSLVFFVMFCRSSLALFLLLLAIVLFVLFNLLISLWCVQTLLVLVMCMIQQLTWYKSTIAFAHLYSVKRHNFEVVNFYQNTY